MKHTLSHAFSAVQHSPQIADYLHSLLKLRFNDVAINGKITMKKALVQFKVRF